MDKYIIEVRNSKGELDFKKERELKEKYPEFFSNTRCPRCGSSHVPTFTIDRLCWVASYGGGRNQPMGPMELGKFMNSIGISYRKKYW